MSKPTPRRAHVVDTMLSSLLIERVRRGWGGTEGGGGAQAISRQQTIEETPVAVLLGCLIRPDSFRWISTYFSIGIEQEN
eukprot:4373773-Pyramimonas_sp.AAC.1